MLMETTENSQLVTASEEIAEMGTRKIISICDHVNWLNYSHDNSDSFVIDMNNFTGKEVPANPRIAFLQRNLSRKGAHGGGKEKSVPYLSVSHRQGKEHDSALHSLSPRAVDMTGRPAAGSAENVSSPKIHHQITITAANIAALSEKRYIRGNCFGWVPLSHSWTLDPKRILFIFATLSSLGTIMLIYFTLTIGRPSGGNDSGLIRRQ